MSPTPSGVVPASGTVPPGSTPGLPTRSRIEGWIEAISALSDSAESWRAASGRLETAADIHVEQMSAPGGTDWNGDAADAARESAYADRGATYRAADHLRDMANVAVRGAQDLHQVPQDALNRYLNGAGATGTFDQRFHAEIENGEGVVGYQYLHGTDQTVGDFHFFGDTVVRPLSDGTYEVTLNSRHTWNDIIDPNPIYSTDQTKSRYAELLSLGQADPYRVAIAWQTPSTVILDGAGNVLEIKGYPAS